MKWHEEEGKGKQIEDLCKDIVNRKDSQTTFA